MTRTALLASLVLGASALFAAPSRAQDARCLVAASSDDDAAEAERLADELEAAGIGAVLVILPLEGADAALARAATESVAVAALVVSGPVIRVVWFDASARAREEERIDAVTPELRRTRAVERARALVAPPAAAELVPRVDVWLGASLLVVPSLDPGASAQLGASVRLDRWLGVTLSASTTWLALAVSRGEDGGALVWASRFSASLALHPLAEGEPLLVRIDVGASLLLALVEGQSDEPSYRASALAAGAGPSLGLTATWAFDRVVRLALAVEGGVSLPPISIRIVGEEAAVLALPWIDTTLALVLSLR